MIYCWTPFVSARARMTHQPQVRGWYAHRSFDLCKKSFTKFILLNYYYTGFILISPWPVAAAGDMYWSQSPADSDSIDSGDSSLRLLATTLHAWWASCSCVCQVQNAHYAKLAWKYKLEYYCGS